MEEQIKRSLLTEIYQIQDDGKIRTTICAVVESYFLLVVAFLSFCYQIWLTTFYCNPWYKVYKYLYVIAIFMTLLKVVIHYKDKRLWFSIPVALVFYLTFPFKYYEYNSFLPFLIIGCVGIKIEKIFCAAFIPSALVIINMMLASLSGAIYSMASLGRDMRSYWGHISPTDFGTAVFTIVAFMWVLLKDVPEEYFLIPSAFSLYISFYITRCNTSGYLTVLFVIIVLCRIFKRRVLNKAGVNSSFRREVKTVDIAMMVVFPILGMLTLSMVYAFYKEIPFASALNTVFHNRLGPAAKMLARYGIKPFGSFFEMRGNGGSTISFKSEYTFIDSSYPQILIRYGWMTYIAANVLWVYTTWKAIKTNHRRLAYVMTLMAIDFVMEHHWYELSYNAFVLISFADFSDYNWGKWNLIDDFKEKWKKSKYAKAFILTGIGSLLAGYLLLPIIFSWLRTIFNGYGLYGGGWKGVVVFLTITAVLIVSVTFIVTFCDFVASVVSEKKIKIKNIIPFLISLSIAAVGIAVGGFLLEHVIQNNTERINSEKKILSDIVSCGEGPCYADKLPEVYIQNIGGISRSYLSGEDFARYDVATVIADASWDSACLVGRGFLYLQISDEDAIYTNDKKVIQSLKEKGYKLKGYNSCENKVNLKYIADINNLEVNEIEALVLEGEEHQVKHGPYVNLRSGKYTVKMMMKIQNIPEDKNAEVCAIRVTSYDGRDDVSNAIIYGRDVDEKGDVTYEVEFKGNGQNYEFLIGAKNGAECDVSYISYRETPDTDVHKQVDEKGRIIRAEYYDLDGNPKKTSDGYYGIEYAYDERDLKIMERYLGQDFEPVNNDSGYAEVHREYNINKKIIKESYFGADGRPVNLSGGQHAVERDYDYLGNVKQVAYYDNEGRPTLLNGQYFKYLRSFDDKNRWIKTSYYDTDDNLVLQKGNYAIIERSYDVNDNAIEESYYGLDDEPVIYNEKYHRVKRIYDNKQVIEEKYYGTDGEPILVKGGYAGYKRVYDDAGNVIQITYLGTDGKSIIIDGGYAICRRKYNSKKQVIREEYYDVNGEKLLRPSGHFAIEYEYDETGNCISESFYGVNDEKVLIKSGYWKVTRTYNKDKKKIHEEYFGTDDKPILRSGKYAMMNFEYNDSGKLVKNIYLDAEGNIVEEKGISKV